jgi:hypothetical protein
VTSTAISHECDAKYIAAANPSTVLALIALARRAAPDAPAADVRAHIADDQWIFDLAAKHETRGRELFGPITFSSTAIVDFVKDVRAHPIGQVSTAIGQPEAYHDLLAALDAYLTGNDYGGLEVSKQYASEVMQAIESARAAFAAQPEPAAWMNPDESCVMDAFIWSHDAQSPRYRVPVYTAATAPVCHAPAADMRECTDCEGSAKISANEWCKRCDASGIVPDRAPEAAPVLLAEILALAESGMCQGLVADDYCSQIVAKIKAAPEAAHADDAYARVLDALHKHLPYPTEACAIVRAVQQGLSVPEEAHAQQDAEVK